MSCFICDKKTIDRILNYISTNFDEFKLMSGKELDNFGQKMVDMNYQAYNYRYDSKEKSYVYIFQSVLVTPIQALKSLKCFLYQASEGNIPEKKLYKMLYKIEIEIMNKVINGLEEYDKAEWG
jgi:hypothetical protein